MGSLHDFVAESNRIEGIHRVSDGDIEAHEQLLELPEIRVPEMECFVREVAGRPLRERVGMNVRVGDHRPPPGGPAIRGHLSDILVTANESDEESPWEIHVRYEKLHPFMDGNGRSGRALWAWMRLREDRDPFALGFLHSAYYEALDSSRISSSPPARGEGQ